MKKSITVSKRVLSLLLAALMILTSIPLLVLPASAESGTLTVSDHVTIATEARKNEKGTDYFENTVWACSDGSLNNTSIGILKFTGFSNIPYGAKVTAKFKMQSDPKGVANENANAAILYATKNETWGFPGQDNTKVNWDGYGDIIGDTIIEGSQNFYNVVNTYGAIQIATVSLNDLGASQKDVEIDLTDAVNYAHDNGKDEMAFIFAMDSNYQGDNDKGWSDTGIGTASTIEWTTNGTYSNTGTPIDNVDTSKLNTTVTATDYGSYKDCADNTTEAELADVYKNVLWAEKDVSSAKVLDSRVSFSGGAYCNNSFWYPTVVFLDDGTSDMQTSVVWSIHPRNADVRVYSTWLNNSDLGLSTGWRGYDTKYNFQFMWYQRSALVDYRDFTNGATGDTIRQNFESSTNLKGNYPHGSGAASNVNNYYFANVMKIKGHLADNELSRKISPSFVVAQSQDGNQTATFSKTLIGAPTSVYIVNYVPLRNAITEAMAAYEKYVAELSANPDKYTNKSVKDFADAINALTAAKPNNYNYSANTDSTVDSYSTNAAAAIEMWNEAKNLVLSEYQVTFNLIGRDPVTAWYTWGTTPAVGDGKVPEYVQQVTSTQHSISNSWPTFETLNSTSVKVYNESLTWEDHNYTGEVTLTPSCNTMGQTTYTCSCGESYTETDIPYSEHTPGEWEIKTPATCTTTGEKIKKCTHCLAVVETETIPVADHDYEFTKTVDPTCNTQGYDLYTCKDCLATKQENPVPATEHGDYITGWGAVAATCTTSGYTGDKKCGKCGDTVEYGTSIPALGHGTVEKGTAELQGYIAATCGTAGYSGDLYCKQCKKIVANGTITNPTGEHTFEWKEITPATCGTTGTKEQVCSCGAKGETETIPATGEHTGGEATCKNKAICTVCSQSYGELNPENHKNTEIRNASTPGCGTAGYTGDTWCTDCDTKIKDGADIPATNQHTGGTATCKDKAICETCGQSYGNYAAHTEGEWVETTPAECLKDGKKTLYCSVCNAVIDTDTIPYIGHQFVGTPKSNNNGTHSYKCTGCELYGNGTGEFGAIINDYDYCAYTARYEDKDDTNHTAYCVCGYSKDVEHNWEETSSTLPTCGEQGKTNYECNLCLGTKTEYEDATGEHSGGTATCNKLAVCETCGQSYGDYAAHTEQIVTGTPATCLTPGFTDGKKCSVCNEILTEQSEITQLTHSYTGAYSFDEVTKTHRQYCVNGCNSLGEAVKCTMKETAKEGNTCTEDGFITYTCEVCKEGYTTILPATGHSYTENVVPPTCTEQGYTEYSCPKCGDYYTDNYVGTIAHTYSKPSKDNLVRPTADTEGYFLVSCSCGATDKIPAERADYTEYNDAVTNLEALLEEDITDEAKEAIKKALEDNKLEDNLIKSEDETLNEQPEVKAAADALTAIFNTYKGDINTYTVKFYVDGKLIKSQENILLGGSATAPEDPKKATDETNHYTFAGWDKTFDKVSANLEVNAVFSETPHKYGEVTFTRNEDGTFTATRICESGETDTATNVVLNSTTETQPDCDNTGNTAYALTATFANGESKNGTVNIPFGAPTHSYGDASITKRPEFIDGEWTSGEITKTCENGDSTIVIETVNRAEYDAYDKAVKALEDLLKDTSLTDTVKEEIKAVLKDNKLENNLIKSEDEAFDEQDDVDKAAAALNIKLEEVNSAIENETALKPDYKTAEDNLAEAEKLSGITADETTVPDVKPSVIEDIKDLGEELDDIKGKTNPEATKAADQKAVDDIAKALEDIIAGIKDGTLVDPNYNAADNAITAADENPNIPAEEKKTIEELEKELQNIKNDPTSNKAEDQTRVDEITTAIEEITNKYSECKDGHDYKWITDKNATCNEDGIKHEECSRCGDKKNENTPISATGEHDYNSVVTAPTCTADGYTTYTCKICNHSYTADTVVTDGHKYASQVTTPTCEKRGFTTYTCSKCGNSYISDYVDTVDHMYAEINDDAKEPTCTQPGLTGYKQCVWCQEKTTATVIPAPGHSWGAWTTQTPATCKAYETQIRYCSACNASQTREYSDSGYAAHKYVKYDGKTPSCGIAGYTAYEKCSVCGNTIGYETLEALTHTWSAWTTKTPATCTEYEVQHRNCPQCGETETRKNTAGGYAEHSYILVEGKAATCDEAGYSDHFKCDSCGDKKNYSEIPAIGHKDENGDGTCDHCNNSLKPEPGADGCICHKNNIFSKIVRFIYTLFSKLFHKRITCCDDMEYWKSGISGIS